MELRIARSQHFDCDACGLGHCSIDASALPMRATIVELSRSPDAALETLLAAAVRRLRANLGDVVVVARRGEDAMDRACRAVGFLPCPQVSGHIAWEHRPFDDRALLRCEWWSQPRALELHMVPP